MEIGGGRTVLLRRIVREAGRVIRHRVDPIAYFRSIGVDIGEHVEIYGSTPHTFGSEPYLVRVGARVTISHGANFITHDGGLRVVRQKHPEAYLYAPIVVEDDAFIGAYAVLLPGVTIGRGAVVGAGAVVSRSIPSGVVAAGVPARPIKTVAEYWVNARDRVVPTSGLSEDAKRRILLLHLS